MGQATGCADDVASDLGVAGIAGLALIAICDSRAPGQAGRLKLTRFLQNCLRRSHLAQAAGLVCTGVGVVEQNDFVHERSEIKIGKFKIGNAEAGLYEFGLYLSNGPTPAAAIGDANSSYRDPHSHMPNMAFCGKGCPAWRASMEI